MSRTTKILLSVGGAVVLVGVAVVATGIWWASSFLQSEPVDAAQAEVMFAAVRARFPDTEPALRIEGGRLQVMKRPPETPSPTRPTIHLLVWESRSGVLARVTVPPWASRIATEPLPLEALTGAGEQGLGSVLAAQRRGTELNIRISDLQRYGPALLLDGETGDGKRVLMWND